MKFSEFATYLEKLEETSSRLSLIEILSDLFKQTPASEIDEIVYLIQGRIAPFFEPLEIGMAEKSVAKSLANVYQVSVEEVTKDYKKQGDLGLVAGDLAKKHESRIKNHGMTVSDVFEILTKIAKTNGEGTVEKRQTLLSDLLTKLDVTSVKHLVRIPIGNTRLGIGDPTVLDGLATAKLGDKSKEKSAGRRL